MIGRGYRSVTKVRCSCGYLTRSARNPSLPVKFDAVLNEYSFEHMLSGGTKISMIIYHCPMCGGAASQSKRSRLFADVSDEEALRLKAIIDELKTVEDIERRLGAADEDQIYDPPADVAIVTQQLTGKPQLGPVRVLTFTRLSETADVQFRIYPNGEIERSIAGKYIGTADTKRKSRLKTRHRSSRRR